MANPRNRVGYQGIRPDTETYKHDGTIVFSDLEENGSAQVGLAVTLGTDDTVTLVGDGEFVLGKLILVESDGKCTVQIGGFMHLPAGTGASLGIGEKIVGDLLVAAEGYIQVVTVGTAAQLGHARGWIQNNDVTTAVLVHL
jgi:hypothetical protein